MPCARWRARSSGHGTRDAGSDSGRRPRHPTRGAHPGDPQESASRGGTSLHRLAARTARELRHSAGERIRERVGDGRDFGLAVDYSEDGPVLRGTAGALRRAFPLLDPEFLVTYGDSYLTFDYAALLGDLVAHPDALGAMSVYHNQGRYDASNTEVRGEQVVRYQKGESDPALDHIDYGALALRREVVANLPEDHRGSLAELQTELAARGRLRAFRVKDRFYEIGSESGLRELATKLGGAG
jgi:N-acetyl-alpha-D-muramate 1-phosphate uridylyltransferase